MQHNSHSHIINSVKCGAHLLCLAGRVVVQHNEVPVCHIEARQMLHSHLSVIDVFIHHKCCAACVLSDTLPVT